MQGRRVGPSFIVALALMAPATAGAAPAVTGEFPLPAGVTVGSNNEIVQGPDGNLWITSDAMTPTIVKMTPAGVATAFTPAGMTQPASSITVGPDGNLWAAEATAVLKIDPANPNAAAQTNLAGKGLANGQGITAGADGNIWMTGTDKILKIPPADPSTATATTIAGLSPKAMATGSDGLLWIADASGRVLSTTTAAPGTVTPYATGGGPQDVAAGPNGQVAFANPLTSPQTVGLITGGAAQTFPLQNTDPFGAVFGQDGAYWVARSQGNDLLRMTTDGTITFLTGFAASGGVGPRKIATGPNNTLWVTLDTPEKIGRVSGVDPPVTDPGTGDPGTGDPGTGNPPATAPDTVLDKVPGKKVKTSKPKAKVSFEFSSPTAGATFECSLTKKGKAPQPKPCTSPATFKVKPGRYLFEVTASAGGLSDDTPSTRSVKVVEKKA